VVGLEVTTSGTVLLNESPAVGVDARCSVVFQEPRLLPWRSVSGNVRLGVRNSQTTNEIQSWLDLVGPGDFSGYLPKQISGGMAHRTALARALIGHQGVLLLDEAFYLADRIVVLGERGQGIVKTIHVDSPRPRDRSDSTFIPLRRELLALFGVHV